MPVSKRRIKKRPGHTSAHPHNWTPLLHYVQATDRNLVAFIREFKRGVAMEHRRSVPEIREATKGIAHITEHMGDFTYWLETSPDTAWLRGTDE